MRHSREFDAIINATDEEWRSAIEVGNRAGLTPQRVALLILHRGKNIIDRKHTRVGYVYRKAGG